MQNTISEISLIERKVFGKEEQGETIDINLMKGILINLGRESKKLGNELLELFNLFLNNKDVRETKSILKNHYKIELTQEIEEEVENMGSWAEGIIDRGIEIGIKQGVEQGVEKSELYFYSHLAKHIREKYNLTGESLLVEISNTIGIPLEGVRAFFKQHPEIEIN